ncbi:hypothetical protein [Rhodopseudomonas sp. B29]|uniref:hypothetical protein n=1 Tax=Rhodopseudomonas sp. B29 TaxID=95607 RepID=UPI0003B30528|nr:hypothetical protein [Rhodopseudomonas sp. B29]
MAITHDDSGPGSKFSLQNVSKLAAAFFTLVSVTGGAAWYLLGPRINQFVDDRIALSQQKPSPGGTVVSSKPTDVAHVDGDAADLKRKLDVLSGDLARIAGDLAKLRGQVSSLTTTVADIRPAYSYSFRFKGSQILAQRWPPNRAYFYAKPDEAVEIDVYLATPKKFPVILKVDGVAMRQVIRDSQEKIPITGRLNFTSLKEMTPATGVPSSDVSPSSMEEPRPENMHYIEFLPSSAAFQFSNDDDFDISGIVRVWRPIAAAKTD